MQGRTGSLKLGSLVDLLESAHREERSEHRRDSSGMVVPGVIDPVEKCAVGPCREPAPDLLPRCSETAVVGRRAPGAGSRARAQKAGCQARNE